MERIYYITLLIDIYGELLTDKQRAVMTDYYFNDCSLNEIAEEYGITRQAVQDMIKRTERLLDKYEQKLMLVDRYIKRKAKAEKISALLDKEIEKGNTQLADIKKLLWEITD